MKYTVDTLNPDWSKYKYYPHLSASEDLLKGGWILHLMAPGSTDRFKDYLRCQSVDTRFARTMKLTSESWNDYVPRYENWYDLQFPMLKIDVISMYGGGMEYDDLPDDIRRVCNMAEKHLLMDQIFEQFVYDKTRQFADEWGEFTSVEKDTLLMQFKDSKRAEDANLRQHSPQAEFDPYYRAVTQDVLKKSLKEKNISDANTDYIAKPTNHNVAKKTKNNTEDKELKTKQDEETDTDAILNIQKRLKDFADCIKGLIQGKMRTVIIYGSSGGGKSYITKQQLEKQFGRNREFDPETMQAGTDDYDYTFIKGKTTSTGFWKTMYQHNGKVIVWDDYDTELKDKKIKGYLQGALGRTDGHVTNTGSKPIKNESGCTIPLQFNFNGTMIFISNLPKKILDKDLQPVMSHSYIVDMNMSRQQTMAYIKHITTDPKTGKYTNMKFPNMPYTHEEMERVVSFLDKHKEDAFLLNAFIVETLLGIYQLSRERAEEEAFNSGKPFNPKEMEEATIDNFNRKANNYLYQHK